MAGITYEFVVTSHINNTKLVLAGRTGKQILVLGLYVEPDGTSGTIRFRSGTSTATTDTIVEFDAGADADHYDTRWGLTLTKPGEGLYVNYNQTSGLNTTLIYMYVPA